MFRRARSSAQTGVVALSAIAVTLGSGAAAFAFTWPASIDVSTPTTSGYAPQLAVAADGTTTAVWESFSGSSTLVEAATRPPGGSWQAPAAIGTTLDESGRERVAVSADGTVTAVWIGSNGVNRLIQAATRTPGGSWQAPTNLSLPDQNAADPAIAVAPDGTATALWDRYDGTNDVVQVATRAPGGPWQAPANLSTSLDAGAFQPQVAVAPDGTTAAVWLRSGGVNDIVQASTRAPGGTWQSPIDVSTTSQTASQAQVAIGADGAVVATWQRPVSASGFGVVAAVRDAGGAWQPPADLSTGEPTSVQPHATVDPSGTATVVWSGARIGAAGETVQAATHARGGAWTPSEDVAPAVAGAVVQNPAVVRGPDGTTVAAWELSSGGHGIIQSASRPAGGSWQSPTTLSAADGNSQAHTLAAGSDGTLAAAWYTAQFLVQAVVADKALAKPVPPVAPNAKAPETGTISGKAKLSRHHAGRFTFTGPTGATFQCKVDKAPWRSCRSPYTVATKRLRPGKHLLSVRAVLAGVSDPTPSVKRFKVR